MVQAGSVSSSGSDWFHVSRWLKWFYIVSTRSSGQRNPFLSPRLRFQSFARLEIPWFVLGANASFLIYFVFLYTYFVSVRSYIFFGLAFTIILSLSFSLFLISKILSPNG